MNFDQLVTIVLEKDNRPKIIKIGLPQEVADYLHNMSDKYSLWFADKISKMPQYQASRDKLRFVHSLQTPMQSILDWVRGEQNIKLNTYNWENALEKSIEYHDRLTVTHRDRETNKIIKEYPDGFYWVDIERSSDSCERDSMGHCARTGKGDTLYSLRKYDKTIDKVEAFITIAISPDDGIWYQCKGKKNSKPKEEYYPYIVNILIEKNVFHFKSEYDTSHDFTSHNLKEYLEENPEEYPNTDEILEKIEGNLITFKDFEKILDEYNDDLKYYSISIDDNTYDDNDSTLYPSYYFHLNIDENDTSLPVYCLTLEYRSEAKRYFENILESVHIENVEPYNGTVQIFGTVRDYDTQFTYDDKGLASFRRQCEYFKDLNEKFDYDDFLKEELEKILALDGCIEKEILNFQKKIEDNLQKFCNIDRHRKTLDLRIILSDEFKMDYDPEDISYFSLMKTTSENRYSTTDTSSHALPSFKKVKEMDNYKEYKHADLALLSIFWDFVRKEILDFYSERMKVTFFREKKDFKVSFNYFFDDNEIDYDKEFQFLENIIKKKDEIKSALDKFIKQYFNNFIKHKKPFTIEDFHVKSEGNLFNIKTLVTKNDESYIETISSVTEVTPELLKDKIREKNLDMGYYPFDEKEVEIWLVNNVSNQPYLPNFKKFFESRKLLK